MTQIHFLLFFFIAISIVLGLSILVKAKSFEKPKRRMLLTKGEYKMYFVLKRALPDYEIFVQVSFGAMLEAKTYSTLNQFLRKRADYVICDKKLNILLILELDGWSHIGKEKEDAARDKLLTDAGYKVLHLKTIPEPEEFKKIFEDITSNAQPHPAKSARFKIHNRKPWYHSKAGS